MTSGIYKPSDILLGYKHLIQEGKTIKDLVKCDIQGMLNGKDYSGVKYMSNTEVYLGIFNGEKIEYGYKSLKAIQIAKVPIAYGLLAMDHTSRNNTNNGASVSIRSDAMGVPDQKVGEALKLLSDAYYEHLSEFTTEQFTRTKSADKINIPYKNKDKNGKSIEPTISIKLKFDTPKGQQPTKDSTFDITILDATKKVNGKLVPLTVNGKRLCYGNMHEIVTMGSQVTGTVKLSINKSTMGLSVSYTFNSLIVKSAGSNKVNVEEALGDVYADLLDDAVDEDEAKTTEANFGNSTNTSVHAAQQPVTTNTNQSNDAAPPTVDDDF